MQIESKQSERSHSTATAKRPSPILHSLLLMEALRRSSLSMPTNRSLSVWSTPCQLGQSSSPIAFVGWDGKATAQNRCSNSYLALLHYKALSLYSFLFLLITHRSNYFSLKQRKDSWTCPTTDHASNPPQDLPSRPRIHLLRLRQLSQESLSNQLAR